MDDILKLQQKYLSSEAPVFSEKSTKEHVRDPKPVKCKGAPKKKKKIFRKTRKNGGTEHNVSYILDDFQGLETLVFWEIAFTVFKFCRKMLHLMERKLCQKLRILAKMRMWM